MLPPTFTQAFQDTVAAHPHNLAVSNPDNSVRLTWRQYGNRVRALAEGLASLGVRRGETVGLMLTNCVEFHLADTATLHAGGTPFSVYNTLAPEQIAHVFGNAANRIVICEPQFLPQVRAAVDAGGTTVEQIVCVTRGDTAPAGTVDFDELATRTLDGFDFEATWRGVSAEDILTIIYTSGTTGPSKGVELTHANLMAELSSTLPVSTPGPGDLIISYLPDAHIANRWGAHYTSIASGMQILALPDMKQLVAVLPTARPSLFGAVPQVWYKVKAGIEAQLAAETSPVKKRLAAWAFDVGIRRAKLRSDDAAVPRSLHLQAELADKIVFSKVRAKLGLDRVRFAATGAAAIDPEALAFVLALGLPCCEIWGMSEVSCAATINPPDAIRIGTVGKALPAAELRIADDGELLVRGPLLMKGYRNQPEKTAETIDTDGWLHTGDIASIDDDGYVRIVDRKKELMINAAGKNMSPANIEGTIKVSSPLVGSAVAIGDDRPYVTALITLDPDAAAAFAQQHDLADPSPKALADDPAVRAALDDAVAAANQRLSRVEQIKKFVILPDVWEPGGDEVTPTMKLKRKPIAGKYADRIEELYR